MLDFEPNQVRSWEDGDLLPSEQQLAALWGALQVDFHCDLSAVRGLFAEVRPVARRLAQVVRTAIAAVRLEPESLTVLVGVGEGQAEALLHNGR